jgi:mRNA-degrading endonuclease RelE of RelBE toxin-antitoxin system
MSIDILPGATADLRELRRLDPRALAVIVTFLQEADADAKLIEKCTTHGENTIGSNRVTVKGWVAARRRSDNLFRFRILDTPATSYRIVYGFDWHTRRVGMLAVVHKDDFDYGISSDLADRIQADWRSATDGRGT